MPIEVFPGKTGDRLIACHLTTGSSYAVLHTTNRRALKVSHQGWWANGYPALSPQKLSDVSEELAQLVDGRHQELVQMQKYRYKRRNPTFNFESDLPGEWAQSITPKPVLPRIMIGEPLMLIMGGHYRDLSGFPVGIVESWDIFNN